MKKRFSLIAFLVFMVLAPVSAVCLDFEPGKYEITSTMEMQGMSIPAQTTTQCLHKKEPVPNKLTGDQGCEISDMQTNGNTITWQMECDQKGHKVITSGEMTYSGDSFEGVMTTNMGPHEGNMTIKNQISGKRIGECD